MTGIAAALILNAAFLNAAFLLYGIRHPDFSPGTENLSMTVTGPVQNLAGTGIKKIRNWWTRYFAIVSAAEENMRLRAEIADAQAAYTRCTETEAANARLRELLKFRRTIDMSVMAAEVIARDPAPWYKGITLNRGSADGVRRGLPVAVPDGIAGLITHVTAHTSRVLLLADPNSAIDALVQRTRARGIVKGQTGGMCSCEYVLLRHEVRKDDILVSSGLDGIFPKGLRIGKVTEVMPASAGIFQKIRVEPFANFENLEEVLILFTDIPHPRDTEDAVPRDTEDAVPKGLKKR